MPKTRSAKKALRKSLRRRLRNLAKKNLILQKEKQFRKALEAKNFEEAKEVLRVLYKLLDKSAKTNLIHKNAARRKKSQLARRLNFAISSSS